MGWVGICVTKSENNLFYPSVKHGLCINDLTSCDKRNIETKIPMQSACLPVATSQYVFNISYLIIFIR